MTLQQLLESLASIPKSGLELLPRFKYSGIVIRGSSNTSHPMRILNKYTAIPLSSFSSREDLYNSMILGSTKHLVFYEPGMGIFYKIPVSGYTKKPMFILKEVPKVLADGYLVVGTTDATRKVFRVTKRDLVRKRVGNAREVMKDEFLRDAFLTRYFGNRETQNDTSPTIDRGTPGESSGENTDQNVPAAERSSGVGETFLDMDIQEQILALSRV